MNVQDRLTIQKQSSLFLVCHKLLSTRLLIKVCTIISILLLLYWLFYNYNETFDFHKDLLFQKTTFLMLKISTLGQNFPRIGDISKRIAKGKEIHPNVYYHRYTIILIRIVYNWYASNYSNLHYLLLFC